MNIIFGMLFFTLGLFLVLTLIMKTIERYFTWKERRAK
tara:strand:- start:560 stop:673 length:114 start_codon:yes stop_codon:yes gene_type:complete